jgi:ATP-dependent helicase/nuclease subunit A
VMTVHQAKGLEFPAVVLGGLGADAHRRETSTFAVGREGQVGLFLKGYRNDTYEQYDPCWGPAAEIAGEESQREQDEDVRVLYVAMTRAQERLVLVGSRPAKDAMDNSRIGRIVSALGLSAFPGNGEVVAVEGLSAAVVGVRATGKAAQASPVSAPQAATRAPRDLSVGLRGQTCAAPQAAGMPRFLRLPSVTGAPERLSFSALAAYQRCPRQFYLERMLGLSLEEDGDFEGGGGPDMSRESLLDADEQHAGREVGILVHRLLEHLAVDAQRPSLEAVREAAGEALSALGFSLSAQELERGVTLTSAVWDSSVASRLSSTSAAREEPFFFPVGGMVVSGVMDLVCRETERWLVADYKTNALRGRSVGEVAASYELQCAVYGLAALRAGAPSVQMDLLFLECPGEPVSVRYSGDDVPLLERELIEAISGLRRGGFPRQVGPVCGHCSVATVCSNMVAD